MAKAIAVFAAIGSAAVVNAARLVADPPAACTHPADYALVLSGDPGARTDHALLLWRRGDVRAIAISGAGYGGDSARVLAAQAKRLEPEVPLVVETAARSTAENVANTCSRVEGRVAIVTDPAHVARALLTARQLCPKWSACAAPTPEPVTFSMQARETLRLLGYQLTARASWGIRP